MFAPEMPAKMKTRMVIEAPKTSATSSWRAVVMPPSCVKTTQPIVLKRNCRAESRGSRGGEARGG